MSKVLFSHQKPLNEVPMLTCIPCSLVLGLTAAAVHAAFLPAAISVARQGIQRKPPSFVSRFGSTYINDPPGSTVRHVRPAPRSLVKRLYRTIDEGTDCSSTNEGQTSVDIPILGISDTLSNSQKDNLEATKKALHDLEVQQNDILLKIRGLESAARRVQREKTEAQGRLAQLQGEIFQPESQDSDTQTNNEEGPITQSAKSDVATTPMEGDRGVLVYGSLTDTTSTFDPNLHVTDRGSTESVAPKLVPRTIEGSVGTDDTLRASPETKSGLEFVLNGKTVGNGKYLLAGEPKKTTSGRSMIWVAYRAGETGIPMGKAVAVKISSDVEAMEMEKKNYDLLAEHGRKGMFVDQLDFFPAHNEFLNIKSDGIQINKKSALVMERGGEDLKELVMRTKFGLEGQCLREIAFSALKCLEDLHASGLVWTDLKTQNFVVFEDDTSRAISIKGIDLESARPKQGHPMDYTPEVTPPEFARAVLLGHASQFILNTSYDIWSFGMFLYELSTGKGFYDGKSLKYITKMLAGALPGYKPTLDNIPDKNLADLAARCLETDPSKRPSVAEIFRHPYFLPMD